MFVCYKAHFPRNEKEDKRPAHVRSAGQRHDDVWNSVPFVCGWTGQSLKKV